MSEGGAPSHIESLRAIAADKTGVAWTSLKQDPSRFNTMPRIQEVFGLPSLKFVLWYMDELSHAQRVALRQCDLAELVQSDFPRTTH